MRHHPRGRRAVTSVLLALGLATSAALPLQTVSASSAEGDARAVTAPTRLAGLGGFEVAHLTWRAVKGAAEYRVHRADSASGPWRRVSTPDPVKATTYDVKRLTNGTTTYFAVTAVKDGRQSNRSAAVAVTPSPTYPLGPGLDAVNYGSRRYLDSPAYSAFAVSASGRQVAVWSGRGLEWYDLDTGQTRRFKLFIHGDMDMSADGRFLVSAQYYYDVSPSGYVGYRRTVLLDTRERTTQVVSRDPVDPPDDLPVSESASISDDGQRVAYEVRPTSGPAREDARVLDRGTGTTLEFSTLPGVERGTSAIEASGIDLSADGSTALVRSNATVNGAPCVAGSCVVVWHLDTGEVRHVPALGDGPAYRSVYGLALNHDGSVAASSYDKVHVVRLGPVAAADEVLWTSPQREIEPDEGGNYQSGDFSDIALSADGSKVGYHTTTVVPGTPGREVSTFHVRDLTAALGHTLDVPPTGLSGNFNRVPSGSGAAFAEDGRYAFVVAPTIPGAEASSPPKRADLLRWEWALTAPE